MWDEYKKVNDSIHVPEELVNRTVKAAEREERRRKIIGLWKYTAISRKKGHIRDERVGRYSS